MWSSDNQNRTQQGLDRQIAAIAIRQHGVFTHAQATASDATRSGIRLRQHMGRWERIFPGVYRLAGTAKTWKQHALAACLALGPPASLSHRAAVVVRSLPGFEPARVEVIAPRNRSQDGVSGVLIHRPRHPVLPEDLTRVDAIPVTKPARTLLDLATVEHAEVVERCLDEMLRRHLVSVRFLESWLGDPRRSKLRGAPVLRRLVAARATLGVTESPLETHVLKLLENAGLPIPVLQYNVYDGERFIARLDFAYPDHRLAIEADGFGYHNGRRVFDNDRARGNEIEARGWRVLRITSEHVERDPRGVVSWIQRALSGSLSPDASSRSRIGAR